MTVPRLEALTLHEQVVLLALREREGTFICHPSARYSAAGAIFAELMLGRHIGLERDDGRMRPVAVDGDPTGDDAMDEGLDLIAGGHPRTPTGWVMRFAKIEDLVHRIASGLVTKGVLDARRTRPLLVFSRRVFPERHPGPERHLRDLVHDAIFGEPPRIDRRLAMLIAVAHHTGLLHRTMDRDALIARRGRIDQITEGCVAGTATDRAFQSLLSAMRAAPPQGC